MIIKYSSTPQGTDEWLAERAGLLTASQAGAMMAGKSTAKYKGLIDKLYPQRVYGYIPDNGFKSADMQRGNDLEPEARAALAWKLNQDIVKVGLATNSKYPGAGASLDGLINGTIGVEIKCPRIHNIQKWQQYTSQIVFQMMICDLEAVYFWGYHDDINGKPVAPFFKRIDRDEKAIEIMRERYLETNELIDKAANEERKRNVRL